MSDFHERLAQVEARIAGACAAAGRPREDVTLVGISKTFDATHVRAAYDAGLRVFGESYAQELRDKGPALDDLEDLEWHFVGPIQTNKAKYIVGRATLVHAVDRIGAAEALAGRAERTGTKAVACLIAVNVGGEQSKHGVAPEDLPSLFDHLAGLDSLSVQGLMCIPPSGDDAEAARPHFRRLRTLRDELLARSPGTTHLPHLSMGMSHDFEVAIQEGATLVRVGTSLFGPRRKP